MLLLCPLLPNLLSKEAVESGCHCCCWFVALSNVGAVAVVVIVVGAIVVVRAIADAAATATATKAGTGCCGSLVVTATGAGPLLPDLL